MTTMYKPHTPWASIRIYYFHTSSVQLFLTGNQLQIFNSQSQIQIGGKWNKNRSRIERPFTGIVAGVVVNGLRVLDLAAEKDIHTSIRGDVQPTTGILERNDNIQKMQQVPKKTNVKAFWIMFFSIRPQRLILLD